MPSILGGRGEDQVGSFGFLVLNEKTLVLNEKTLGMLRSDVGLPKGHIVLSFSRPKPLLMIPLVGLFCWFS